MYLIVAGEQSKNDNLCAFPINPELKADCPIWWESHPKHLLGPHNGKPGKVLDSEWAKEKVGNIFNASETNKCSFKSQWHYPGDNEIFGQGVRLTDHIGLKTLGIWYEILPPGHRSAFPHAHTHEEEFGYIIKGKPTVWLNGYTKELQEGDYVAFPSNTGLAHTIINDTSDDIIYLIVGETEEFAEEKIDYPLNPTRNKECKRQGFLWDSPPHHSFGSAPSTPKNRPQGHLAFQPAVDVQEVYKLFAASPSYFKVFEGAEPSINTAQQALVDGPSKSSEKYFKEVFIIECDQTPIGLLDIHAHHPEVGICYLGLLLIKESLFGQGLGKKAYLLAEDYIKRSCDCQKIRLGVAQKNNVMGFWEKMGFVPNGNSYTIRLPNLVFLSKFIITQCLLFQTAKSSAIGLQLSV